MWVLWYDTSQNKIHVVRTNAAVSRFGTPRTIAAPPSTIELDGLQAEGSQGPLDVVAVVLHNGAQSTSSYWDTQLPPKFSLPGATVSFLGKTVKANSKGAAQITVPKGTATGKHTATMSKPDYTPATFTVNVT